MSETAAIAYSEKLAFCCANGVEGDDREYFFNVIGELDKAYLEWHAKKREAERSKQAAAKKPGMNLPRRGTR